MDEFFKEDFVKKIEINDLAQFEYKYGLFCLLLDKKEESYKYILKSMNINNDIPAFLKLAFHNIALSNIWFIKDSNKEILKLKNEINTTEIINKNIFSNIQNNLFSKQLKYDNCDQIINLFLFSLNILREENVNKLEDIYNFKNINNFEANTILGLAEILLSLQEKEYKEIGKKLLNLIKINCTGKDFSYHIRLQILYIAYFIDYGKISDAKYLLKNLIQKEVQPWEDYYIIMAYQLLSILSKNNPEEKAFASNYVLRGKEYQEKNHVSKFANKFVWLQTQNWSKYNI